MKWHKECPDARDGYHVYVYVRHKRLRWAPAILVSGITVSTLNTCWHERPASTSILFPSVLFCVTFTSLSCVLFPSSFRFTFVHSSVKRTRMVDTMYADFNSHVCPYRPLPSDWLIVIYASIKYLSSRVASCLNVINTVTNFHPSVVMWLFFECHYAILAMSNWLDKFGCGYVWS